MAELGDALGSGPSARKGVGVQIPFPAYATFGGIDCPVRLYLTWQAMITERLQ